MTSAEYGGLVRVPVVFEPLNRYERNQSNTLPRE